jgi:glycosyltransferase involved in cell wall biosynthesis
MKKRILILNINVSGMNKYLFSQLKKYGWELDIHEVPLPKRLRIWAKIISFSFNIGQWKTNFDYHLNKLYKSSWCFKWRTKWCENLLMKKEGEYDLVLNMTGMNAPVLNIEKFPKLKYFIVTSYNMILSKKYDPWCAYPHELKKWISMETTLYKNSSLIFTTNNNVIRSLINDYGIERNKMLKMGYGLTFDEVPDFKKKYDGKTILFIGYDFKRKGGYTLLEAFKGVRNEIPASKLIIIGPNKAIYNIKQEGVEFLGPIKDREEIKKYYKNSSIFVMPSICEPFGLVMLEAMAYKLPCIGANVDAMKEIIDENETGFLVKPFDIKSLTTKILKILKDKHLNAAMGEQARNKLINGFSWDNAGNLVDQKLEELLN